MKSFGCKNLNLHEMISCEILVQRPDKIFRKNENFSKKILVLTFYSSRIRYSDPESIPFLRFGVFFKISVVNSIL